MQPRTSLLDMPTHTPGEFRRHTTAPNPRHSAHQSLITESFFLTRVIFQALSQRNCFPRQHGLSQKSTLLQPNTLISDNSVIVAFEKESAGNEHSLWDTLWALTVAQQVLLHVHTCGWLNVKIGTEAYLTGPVSLRNATTFPRDRGPGISIWRGVTHIRCWESIHSWVSGSVDSDLPHETLNSQLTVAFAAHISEQVLLA